MPRVYLKLIIAVLALAYSLSYADYHYVSHSGTNTYPYTSWETAADSIGAAIGAASPHDTIFIASGDYYEMIRMAHADSCLTFIGTGVDSTHCWTDIDDLWIVSDQTAAQDIWFEENNPNRSCYSGWIDASTIARHCKFTSSLNSGPFRPGGILSYGDSVIIENCEFNNLEVVFDGYAGKLVFSNNYLKGHFQRVILADWSWGIIENNILLATGGAPFFSEPTDYSDSSVFRNNYLDHIVEGFQANAPLTCSVENNTTRNSIYGSQVFYNQGDPGHVTYRNNAFTESQYGISAGNEGYESLHVAYNGFWDNRTTDIYMAHWEHVDTVGNIHAYPLYANPDSFDVHLQAYSPFINAGDPLILDVDGTRSDIGCYGGPGGCSYTYLDLAPLIPDSISGAVDSNVIYLTWRRNYESDFNRYQVFRDTIDGFSPSVFNMIAEPDTCFYQDTLINPATNYYYRLTAVDNQRNVSDYSDEVAVRLIAIRGFDTGENLPKYSIITSAYPNPFNSQITIVYSASNLGPQPPEIRLMIYDVTGRVIRTLVNEHKPCGTYRVIWDGKDDKGVPVSSGSYIAKVSQWGMSGGDFPIKITLVK